MLFYVYDLNNAGFSLFLRARLSVVRVEVVANE